MKIPAAVASAVALLVVSLPSLALACPAAAGDACCSSSSGVSSYMAALGVGLLAGIGSVSLEGFFRKNKGA